MTNKRKLFIITGMSGAGKSQALKIFGDFGFYCVDNLPLALFKDFIKYVLGREDLQNIALGIDVREGESLKDMPKMLQALGRNDFAPKVIFLDAADECLIRRFSETKHKHPIHKKLAAAISHEREILSPIQILADKVIDTSDLKLGELKEKLSILLESKREGDMQISVVSFGFKHGILKDCDIVMDVRFLPNPYYVPERARLYFIFQRNQRICGKICGTYQIFDTKIYKGREKLSDHRHGLYGRQTPQRVYGA